MFYIWNKINIKEKWLQKNKFKLLNKCYLIRMLILIKLNSFWFIHLFMESSFIQFLVKMCKRLLGLNNMKDLQESQYIKDKQCETLQDQVMQKVNVKEQILQYFAQHSKSLDFTYFPVVNQISPNQDMCVTL